MEAKTFTISIDGNDIDFSPTNLELVIYLDPFVPGTGITSAIVSDGVHYIIVKVEYVVTKDN